MKLLLVPLVIQILAVITTVDCLDFLDGLEEDHYSADDETRLLKETPPFIISRIQEPYLPESEEEISVDDSKSVAERSNSRGCSPTISCVLAGGHCIKSREDCNGTIDPRGCKGGRSCNCKCCISDEPMRCPNGTFLFPSTNQCFNLFNNAKLNWTDANNICLEKGLALAKPYDARALRTYIIQRFGPDNRAWLGARGDNSTFKWQDGQELSSSSPLWFSGQPGQYVDTDHCLEFLPFSHSWNSNPDQPFYVARCSTLRYPLCEATMAHIFPMMK